jgi:APA family basic amino acid/polyamine antiporter
MARKLPRLQRVLDAPVLASVAYGEVASSLYFALGIVALHALGLTPAVLGIVGVLFLVVTLSYAEGTTSIGETGGAATFVRVAFNDLAGFVTGWALFLDYLIVIALSALFFPHYLGLAIGWHSIAKHPGDAIVGCIVIGAIALVRLLVPTRLYSFSLAVPLLDLVTQLLLVVLGFAFLFSPSALGRGLSLGTQPTWHDLAFALPLALLAYTGLETVANLAEETRQPGRDLPRSLFTGMGAVVLVTVLIALVALSAFPVSHGTTELGTTWQRAPLMGVVYALGPHVAFWVERMLRVYVGLTGALILLTAAATSNSGFGRLAYSLAEHGQLPRRFGRLSRRSLHSPETVVAAAAISIALLLSTSFTTKNSVGFLASLFSFGVLVAFTAAQLAVVKLRFSKPNLERPFRVPLSIRVRGADVPLPTVVGALATTAIFVAAMATHIGARYAGPIWLACGVVVYLLVRRGRGAGLLEHVEPAVEGELPQAEFSKILVPMKLGEIGEEMVATAVKLAQERGAAVVALHVIRVPLDQPLDAELLDEDERAAASLAEAAVLGADLGVAVEGRSIRARSIGEAIVQAAEESGADLIVLGSSPKWRRQSRFFSPTVEYVLRKAPAEVLVVAFPQGVLEEV